MKLLPMLLMVLPLYCHSQKHQNVPLDLQHQLKDMAPNAHLDLFLRGDASAILSFVRSHAGAVKSRWSNISWVSLPTSSILELNDLEGLEFIEFASGKPSLLNDRMILNNNIMPVHQGISPLPAAYTGSDVIIGYVDTGIELSHPDFQHADGTTRVIALWDQNQEENVPFRIPEYGYGQEWTSEDIDAGITNHDDQSIYFGHGSTVAGTGSGNAFATGEFIGVAPESDIIIVSSDFNKTNWTASVAEAIDYIFSRAEAVGKSAVINLSLGDYYGSHDGLDAPTLFIDSLLDMSSGRVVVAAAGNSGNFGPYHLGYEVPASDTAFTWFEYNPNTLLGEGAVFFEIWADTTDFNSTYYSIGADLTTPNYEFRGYSQWRNALGNLNTLITDTIEYEGLQLGIVQTWLARRGAQYLLQVKVSQPFSSQYVWRFASTGGGSFDCWSYAPFGSSGIVYENMPNFELFPDILNYRYPDELKTMVSAWANSNKVLTVGNYVNRSSFINYLGEVTAYGVTPGEISANCSRGPTRDMRQKPDIAASGDNTLSAGRIATLNSFVNLEPHKVAQSGMHYINGGTSMASPVVAGVAALYLEMNPEADYAEILQAVTSTALADEFTGILPGNQFGFGKLDAFATVSLPFSNVGIVAMSHSETVKIYPNPSSTYVLCESKNQEIIKCSLYDLSGRKLLDQLPSQSDTKIKISTQFLNGGVYLLELTLRDGQSYRSKLIVAN